MDKAESDAERVELAKAIMLRAVSELVEDDCPMGAILIVTDGRGMQAIPLRLTKEQAFSVLVAACMALEPEDVKEARDAEDRDAADAAARRLN